MPCYTLSRLKGIETNFFPRNVLVFNNNSCYTLSRLKGIETIFLNYILIMHLFSCYTLSRLKGIETNLNNAILGVTNKSLAIHFPV